MFWAAVDNIKELDYQAINTCIWGKTVSSTENVVPTKTNCFLRVSVGLYLVERRKRLLFDKVLHIVRFLKITLKV